MSETNRQNYPDQTLLMEMRGGSIAAFDLIYDRYWEVVYCAAFKRLKNTELSKDITQETFMKLWASRNQTEILNLPAYLFSATRNNVFKLLEKERRYVPIPASCEETNTSDPADALVLKKDFLNAFDRLTSKLTSSQQVIFKMKFQQGQSTSEIAEQLGITRKTVQNQLGRSLALFRDSLMTLFLLLLAHF